MKTILALFFMTMTLSTFLASAADTCQQFLKPSYSLYIDELSFKAEYAKFKKELDAISKEQSVRKAVSLFNSFKSGYHERYDIFTAKLTDKYPELKSDYEAFYRVISSFHKMEKDIVTFTEKTILQLPAKKRIHYLRSLNPDQLAKNSILLDALFGIDIQKLDQALASDFETNGRFDLNKKKSKFGDEEIWYAPEAGQQTDWSILIKVIENLNLQNQQLIADFGSGIGRLGFLIGLLRPDVQFIGLEIVSQRVDFANATARQNGFLNISFKTTNLADVTTPLPQADHIYMYNPTSLETSDILTERLIELAQKKQIEIHILSNFQSARFNQYFISVDYLIQGSDLKTYVKRRY